MIAEQNTDVEAFLLNLHDPGDVYEIRSFKCPESKGSRFKRNLAGWFDDAEEAAKEIERLSSLEPDGIYVTCNPVSPSLRARSHNKVTQVDKQSSDNDVVRRRWLFLDIDAKRSSGVSSTGAEMQAAVGVAETIADAMQSRGWPDPLFGMSGNGAYLCYRIDLPNNQESTDLIKRVLVGLSKEFSTDEAEVDTSTFNPSRIMKVLGTVARKGDDFRPDSVSQDEHRPHRRSWFRSPAIAPSALSIEQLESVAAEKETPPKSKPYGSYGGEFDLASWIAKHGLDVRSPKDYLGGQKWQLSSNPLCEHKAPDVWIGQTGEGVIAAKCSHNSCNWNWHDLREHFEPKRDRYHQREERPKAKHVHEADFAAGAGSSADKKVEPIDDYRPFPTDLLPAVLGEYVRQSAKAIGCDEAYVALPAMTAIGAAIGNARRLQMKRTWHVLPTIWTAVVGLSGTAKTPAQKQALAPFKRLQSEAMQEHRAAMEAYEADLEVYEAERKKNKGVPTGDKPDKPKCRRILVQDITTQALAPMLADNPKGVLLSRDELAGWFASFNQYNGKKGADESAWLSMFDGDSITVDRKSEDSQAVFVPSAVVSITGGIQPAILRESLTAEHRSSGLAARILMAMPPRKLAGWTEDDVDFPVTEAMRQTFESLHDFSMVTDEDGHLRPQVVKMNEGAKDIWVAFYNDQIAIAETITDEDEAAVASKLRGYVPRIALLLHCCRQAAGEFVSDDLDSDSMLAAIGIVEWFGTEIRRIYTSLDDDKATAKMRALVEWIKTRHDGKATARQVQQGVKRIKSSEDAQQELTALADAGLGEWDHGPRTSVFTCF
ncbi:YfjI family protein [Roseiconus lacunae]|uniref:YfjI family protein n=1 Tax=Roseiconus lacunae TaxID=2605694 RepID=UPI003089E83B|nr:YfjI family protein [Stieleria sp. HD01]